MEWKIKLFNRNWSTLFSTYAFNGRKITENLNLIFLLYFFFLYVRLERFVSLIILLKKINLILYRFFMPSFILFRSPCVISFPSNSIVILNCCRRRRRKNKFSYILFIFSIICYIKFIFLRICCQKCSHATQFFSSLALNNDTFEFEYTRRKEFLIKKNFLSNKRIKKYDRSQSIRMNT